MAHAQAECRSLSCRLWIEGLVDGYVFDSIKRMPKKRKWGSLIKILLFKAGLVMQIIYAIRLSCRASEHG